MTSSDEQSAAHLPQEDQQASGQAINGSAGSSNAALQSELFRAGGQEVPPPPLTIVSPDAAPNTQPDAAAEQKQSVPVKSFNSNNFFMIAGEGGSVNAAPRGTFSKLGLASGTSAPTSVQNAGNTRPALGDAPSSSAPLESNGIFSGSYELNAIKDENPLAKYVQQQEKAETEERSQKEQNKLWAEKHQLEQGHWGHISQAETNERIEKINDELGLHGGHRTYYSTSNES